MVFIELLDYLKPKYQLHIITNGFASVQTKKMKNSKIDHYFETITNSEMAGFKNRIATYLILPYLWQSFTRRKFDDWR